MHDDQASSPLGSRADRFPDSFSANNKTNSAACESKPLEFRPSNFGGSMGRRHAVCEWMARPGPEDTHRYHVTNSGSDQGHSKIPRIAETDAERCGDDTCVPRGRSCK